VFSDPFTVVAVIEGSLANQNFVAVLVEGKQEERNHGEDQLENPACVGEDKINFPN